MKNILLIIVSLLVNISFSQSIEKFSIDSGGASVSAGNIELLYTIGEVNVQELSAGNISISEGFINPIVLKINISPIALLQGAMLNPNTGEESLMRDDLRSNGLIETTSPYIDAITAASAVFDLGGTSGTGLPEDDIVDWVWVELRDAIDNTTVIESRSALLQRDGDVVGVDGVSALRFNSPVGNYYLMIAHRNHVGILSANTVSLSGTVTAIDFSADSALVTGGINGIADMGDGTFALFSGDYSGDGQIQNSDKIAVEVQRGLSGYINADIDMNNQVQNTDLNIALNPNIGRGEQTAKRNLSLFAKRRDKTKK